MSDTISTGLQPLSKDVTWTNSFSVGNSDLITGFQRLNESQSGSAMRQGIRYLASRSPAGFMNRINDGGGSQTGNTAKGVFGYAGLLTNIRAGMEQRGYMKPVSESFLKTLEVSANLYEDGIDPEALALDPNTVGVDKLAQWQSLQEQFMPPNQNPKRVAPDNILLSSSIQPDPAPDLVIVPPTEFNMFTSKFGGNDPNPSYPLPPADPAHLESATLDNTTEYNDQKIAWNGRIAKTEDDCRERFPAKYIPAGGRPGSVSTNNAPLVRTANINGTWSRQVKLTQSRLYEGM